jgi:uncharacterized lipoprotein YmbA
MKYITIALSALVLLTGCSTKSNFYQMHPKAREKSGDSRQNSKVIIGIAKVEVSEYLDKPEIVTRLSAGRLSVHEKERWVGSFAKNLQSVLQHNLSAMLPRYALVAYPWEEPLSDRYRIYLTIDRFDGDAAGMVTLSGRWSLVDREDDRVIIAERINDRLQGGTSLDAIVDTQSRLLYTLSRHIAQRVRSKI